MKQMCSADTYLKWMTMTSVFILILSMASIVVSLCYLIDVSKLAEKILEPTILPLVISIVLQAITMTIVTINHFNYRERYEEL
jgi:putative effector of murein hydrolase